MRLQRYGFNSIVFIQSTSSIPFALISTFLFLLTGDLRSRDRFVERDNDANVPTVDEDFVVLVDVFDTGVCSFLVCVFDFTGVVGFLTIFERGVVGLLFLSAYILKC